MGVTNEQISRVLGAVPKGLLIGGKWIETEKTLPVEDPSTGEVLAEVADATPEEGIEALDAAVAAAADWAATDPRERGEILRRAFDLLVERADDIALLMTLEMGKPLAEARGEVTYGAEFFRWFSEEAVRIAGRYSVAPSGGTRLLTMKQPVGPVYAITPWNFPLAMGTRKIGPALAAGCTVVIKPAAQTPLTTLALAAVLIEAGLPDGVVNVITTSTSGKVSEPIIADPRLRKLTFTGSTSVGQRLIEQSAKQVLKLSMELGGNAPFLVFADADLDKAVDGAMLAKMRNIGEACTAANRFIVHESVAAEFAAKLAERMGAMTIGRGIDDGVQVGPLVDAAAVDKVTELVADAVEQGGRGAHRRRGDRRAGPLLSADRADRGRRRPRRCSARRSSARSRRSSPSAPTTRASPWPTTPSSVWSPTPSPRPHPRPHRRRAAGDRHGRHQPGHRVQPGRPVRRRQASGLGREGGLEGIEEYLETKYVGIKL